ncbi:MAG TPA: AMP-binding protein [Albitalea sp.]|nr:AMP-binding protein [Albitalea sp.]
MWWNPWLGSMAMDVAAASRALPEALKRLQTQRLAALLQAAQQRSPLYREVIGRRDPQRLALHELPVMTKPELMQRFDDWVGDRRLRLADLRRFMADPARVGHEHLGEYLVWESSGSGGQPGVFVQDAHAMAVYDALEALRRPQLQPLRRLVDPFYAAERMAFVGATNGHFAATASVQRLRRLNPWLAAGMHSLSFLQPARDLVAELNALRPTVLATYPTAALMLAEEAAAGRLRIGLKEVWTGGEALTDAMRGVIGRSFGCPVAQSYGASEFMSMASECRCGMLHLNSDWLILESVDEQGRPVSEGQAGFTTLLTNLANAVQPVIRYDLGDRVTMHSAPCRCGSWLPVIEVQGRVDDSVVLRDGEGQSVRLLPLALTTVLEDEAGVFDFQLVQQGEQALLLRLAAGGADGSRQLRRARGVLSRYLRAQGLPRIALEAHCGQPGVRGRSGKVQRVVALAHPHAH